MLERFAAGTKPTAAELDRRAAELELDTTAIRETLTRADLVHFDPNGAALVAYPFSADPRGHHLTVEATIESSVCALTSLAR